MAEAAPSSAAALTRRAVEAARAGELADARQLLSEALSVNPDYEPAWMWFASVAETDAHRRFCLDRAVEAKPGSEATAARARLRQVAAEPPPEVEHLLDPPVPDDLRRPPRRRGRRHVAALVAAMVVLLVLAATLILARSDDGGEPVYLAVVAGLSGPNPVGAREIQQGAQLYLDELNARGGIAGNPVKLLTFDDQDDPDIAKEKAAEIVADPRILGVIGHRTSSTSLAAAATYNEANIPVISPTATADEVTEGNPVVFSTVFNNSAQGGFIATYLADTFEETSISLIASDDDYGSSLGDSVADAFTPLGAVDQRLEVPATDATTAQLETILAPLLTTKPSGTIVLAVGGDLALEIIPILRRGGVDNRIIGGDSVGANSVSSALSAATEPGEDADLLTHDVLATAPLFTDALSGEAVEWLYAFEKQFGYRPTWRGATSYEAAATFAFALESGGLSFNRDDRDEDRDRAREAIDRLDSPERSIHGLNGPVYFQDSGASGVPVRVGSAEVDRFVSAARQLVPYAQGDPERTEAALAAGRLVQAGDRYFERQRVVTIGVNINTVSDLDVQNSTFTADFFLWLRYTGDDDAAEITFPNAVEAGLSLGDPVRVVRTGDTSYQLYRVEAAFTGDFNFRDFPFDAQELRIEVQNATLPSSRIVYAGDLEVLRLTQEERLASGSNSARTINAIDDWDAKSTFYSQESVGSTAALGDPDLQGGETGLSYSAFVTSTTIERDVSSFLVKNLLPLALLAAVTYVSLYFSHGGGGRVSFGITGILTGAVLLQSVTSSLPNVGYTVALEWGYYGFILLSACCVLVGMLGDRFNAQRRLATLRRLDLISRVGYPLVCVAIVGTYVALYA